MDIKNIFKHGKKVSQRKFRLDRCKSPMMRDFFGTNGANKDRNQKVLTEIFDQNNELTELNRALYDKSKGGLTKMEMKEVIGGLKTLSAKEKYKFAKVIFPGDPSGERFIRPKKDIKSSALGKPVINSESKKAGFRITGPTSESKKVVAPTNGTSAAPTRITAIKSQPTKQYTPGRSLDFEFAKPGFQSEKDPAKKKDVEIKPVAPEAYAKIPGTSQEITKNSEETGANSNKSKDSISNTEEKKREVAKPLSPEEREALSFPKSTLSGSADQFADGKSPLAAPEASVSSANDISASKAIKTEALLRSARRSMLAARKVDGSKTPGKNFFGSMAATMKRKANS